MYKATILRLKEDDPRIKELPDWSEKFNGSVGAAQKRIENGLILPKGGVIVLSTKSTAHFLLSTGAIAQVVAAKTRAFTNIGDDISLPSKSQTVTGSRRKSAWQTIQAKFGFGKSKPKQKIAANPKSVNN